MSMIETQLMSIGENDIILEEQRPTCKKKSNFIMKT